MKETNKECRYCDQFYFCPNSQDGQICENYSPVINNSKGMFRRIYTWKGRIRRKEYCLSYAIFSVSAIVLGEPMQSPETYNSIFVFIASFLLLLLRLILVMQSIKRSHDLGNSGWWILLPIYSPFWMLFAKGDEGINDYGSNPKEEYESHFE